MQRMWVWLLQLDRTGAKKGVNVLVEMTPSTLLQMQVVAQIFKLSPADTSAVPTVSFPSRLLDCCNMYFFFL